MGEELETIIGIEEFDSVPFHPKELSCSSYSGFCVTTDKQEIFIAISSMQSCCENWGYLVMNDDDKEAFIGATLKEITTTDTALKTKALEDLKSGYVDAGDCVFVNLETSRGTLQFAVYNAHNGYYGHEVFIRSTQLNLEQRL